MCNGPDLYEASALERLLAKLKPLLHTDTSTGCQTVNQSVHRRFFHVMLHVCLANAEHFNVTRFSQLKQDIEKLQRVQRL